MNIKKQLKYFTENQPRGISEFKATFIDINHVDFDGHGEELNTTFKLQCKCGSEAGKVLLQFYQDDRILSDPISIQCETCGENTLLFDSQVHGYDGELGHNSPEVDRIEQLKAYKCINCNKNSMGIIVRFEYPDDLLEDDFDDFRGKEQDLFSWFTILGICKQCDEFQYIEDFECA